jgi:protein subunit release factor A
MRWFSTITRNELFKRLSRPRNVIGLIETFKEPLWRDIVAHNTNTRELKKVLHEYNRVTHTLKHIEEMIHILDEKTDLELMKEVNEELDSLNEDCEDLYMRMLL